MLQYQRRLLPVCVYLVLIFAASSIPSLSPPGPDFVSKDKVAHVLEYSVLGVLLFRGAGGSPRPSRVATFAFLFAIGVTVAAVDEIYQSFIPGRMMSVYDWFADVSGIAVGVGIPAIAAKSGSARPRGRTGGRRDAGRASDRKPI
ncbi:MAG: VanZ family protein [bacterium]